jgi:magnesium transporter
MSIEENLLDQLHELARSDGPVPPGLESLRPEDVSDALERMDPEEGGALLAKLGDELAAQSLIEASTETTRALVEELPDSQLARYLDLLPMDDALDLREEIGDERYERLLGMIPKEDAGEIQRLLSYPEDSVARVMTEHFFRVDPGMTMRQVMEDLRRSPEEKYETINDIYVLDDRDVLLGVFSLRKGLRADPDIPVSELMNKDLVVASVLESDEDAARRMSRYGLYALPVVDPEGRMVGLFTGDDAQDILNEAETEDVLKLGGVSGSVDAYMTLSIWQLVMRRLPWLGALFVAETLTGSVMRYYGTQDTELGINPLMFFIPLIIGAGGNAGAQVTTTLTRALAIGDVFVRDWLKILGRELCVAAVIGATLGALGFLRAWFGWKSGLDLSLVVAMSLPLIVLWAATVGSLLPIGAKKVGIDPAVMSAPFITTIVDATGLIIYFEIAHRVLLP